MVVGEGFESNAMAEPKGEEYVLKFVLVGESNVGKSQLVSRFSKDEFSPDIQQTVGMEFATRELAYYGGATLKAQVWDTAGQERFHSLTQAYYRGAVGAMVVFDITDRKSFDCVPNWLRQIKDNAHRNIALSLVANKSDRGDERVVTTAEGLAFAEANGMDFVETSAQISTNVETAFRRLIMAVARLLPEGKKAMAIAAAPPKKEDTNVVDVEDGPPPLGWLRLPSLARDGCYSYENIWTGERVGTKPTSMAVEYNTIQARALTHSIDVIGIGLREPERNPGQVGITCGSLGGNCTVS